MRGGRGCRFAGSDQSTSHGAERTASGAPARALVTVVDVRGDRRSADRLAPVAFGARRTPPTRVSHAEAAPRVAGRPPAEEPSVSGCHEATTAGMAATAFLRWSSAVSPGPTFAMTTIGRSGTSCRFAIDRAARSKLSHTIATVGIPRRWSLVASSKLPAVQLPHIPTPATATCTSRAISSMSDSGAGAVPGFLDHTRTSPLG